MGNHGAQRIEYVTEDGVTIVGDWCEGTGTTPWAVLFLHMMPSDRASWRTLAQGCATRGFSSLAIDFRGHGESTRGPAGTLDYRSFTNEDHKASIADISAAHTWLLGNEIPADHVFLVGASIGANLALHYCVMNPKIRALVLLSPGLEYHGIETSQTIRRLHQGQQILFVVSDDDHESASAVEYLDRITTVQHEVIRLKRAGHGSCMIENDRFLDQTIIQWMEGIRGTLI